MDPSGKRDETEHRGKTVCLVPAHNEAGRIGAVLDVLTRSALLDDVLVIDDGSTDDTSAVAAASGARVLTLPSNLGKGAALQAGIEAAGNGAQQYLFIDADLISLSGQHLELLLEPLAGDSGIAMVVGIAQAGRFRVDLAQRFFPVLNGQRALTSDFVSTLPDLSSAGWGVEVILSAWAKARGEKTVSVKLPGLSQVMKEEKDGVLAGIRQRYLMYKQVLAAYGAVRRLKRRSRNSQRPGKAGR